MYADEFQRNGQMIYSSPKAIYNVTADEIESSLAEDVVQTYDLNSFGLSLKRLIKSKIMVGLRAILLPHKVHKLRLLNLMIVVA